MESMSDLHAEALLTFRELLDEARVCGDPEPTAMTVSTVGADGRVSARTVLLKHFDERGFVFYTNTDSLKGRQLGETSRCSLLFLWKRLHNQVQARIEGLAELVSDAEADAYFASRPRMSQIGAWASKQSQTLPSRDAFEQRIAEFEERFADQDIPRPPNWSGYRVVPDRIEFWYGADFRLHNRDLYECDGGEWSKRKLYP